MLQTCIGGTYTKLEPTPVWYGWEIETGKLKIFKRSTCFCLSQFERHKNNIFQLGIKYCHRITTSPVVHTS